MQEENKKKKQYWVLIEPVDPRFAWFFLTTDGKCEYKNTLDNSCTWDYIPTKEEILSMLDKMGFEEEYSYYVVEPYLVPGKKLDFNVKVIEEEIVEDNELSVEEKQI